MKSNIAAITKAQLEAPKNDWRDYWTTGERETEDAVDQLIYSDEFYNLLKKWASAPFSMGEELEREMHSILKHNQLYRNSEDA